MAQLVTEPESLVTPVSNIDRVAVSFERLFGRPCNQVFVLDE